MSNMHPVFRGIADSFTLSSPPAAVVEPADSPMPGSIPACAGEPSATAGWPTKNGVYPRLRGGTSSTQLLELPEKTRKYI